LRSLRQKFLFFDLLSLVTSGQPPFAKLRGNFHSTPAQGNNATFFPQQLTESTLPELFLPCTKNLIEKRLFESV
jgi:hypothetical protein